MKKFEFFKNQKILENETTVISLLKGAFSEEMNAWYQYIIIAPFLQGDYADDVKEDYAENAQEELVHANLLLKRIQELGSDYSDIASPESWNETAQHKYMLPSGIYTADSVKQMYDAEQDAIDTYNKIIDFTQNIDKETCKIANRIINDEKKHLAEMQKFITKIQADNKE